MESLPQLPEGLSLDELRFVHPEAYPLSMAAKGWSAQVSNSVDGNHAKVSYSLGRPVPAEFGMEELASLSEAIGITEEGTVLPGYSLRVDSFREDRPLAHSLREVMNPAEENDATLVFNFTGFPTEKTMQVLIKLEEAFTPPRKKRLSSLLGKLGLRQ